MSGNNFRSGVALPADVQLEKSFLGRLLITSGDFKDVAIKINPEDFYDYLHQSIFKAMILVWNSGRAINKLNVEVELKTMLNVELEDCLACLETLESFAQFGIIDDYCKRLVDLSGRRKILAELVQVSSDTYNQQIPLNEVKQKGLGGLVGALGGIGSGDSIHPITMKDLTSKAMQLYASNAKSPVYGIPTGFYDLDKVIGGMLPGKLIILAGRPGMGKTTVQFEIMRHAAEKHSKNVLFISLEMTDVGLVTRLYCNTAGLDYHRIMRGIWTPSELQEMEKATEKTSKWPVTLFCPPFMNVDTELPLKLRAMFAQQKFDLVMIDYLGLLSSENGHGKTEETTQIVGALRTMSLTFNVPFLVACQLSRSVEARADKRPMLSDLRDSGAIEQAADIVIMLYRHGYYNPAAIEGADELEMIVAKNRDGATETITTRWDGEHFRVTNLYKGATP